MKRRARQGAGRFVRPENFDRQMSFAHGKSGVAFSRLWHLVDAKGQVLGHLSSGIASVLAGQHKPIYDPSNDCGDYVVVVNARHLVVSGEKRVNKIYRHHTGYPGGVKAVPFWMMQERKPEEIVYRAVKGMLAKNGSRDRRLQRLHIFADAEHPFENNIARFYEDPDLENVTPQQWATMTPQEMVNQHESRQRQRIEELMTALRISGQQ